jgi:hypothetical protein
MKTNRLYGAGVLAFLVLANGAAHAGAVWRVKAIEFKGLQLMSKYDIIRGARVDALPDGIAVDMDSLERALSRNSFIQSYRVDEYRGRLIVSVTEKKPELIMSVARGDRSVLYELDAAHAIISKNNVHTDRVPVLNVAAEDIAADAVTGRIKGLFSVLARVRERNLVVYRELSEIFFDGSGIRVILRGRKTVFAMKPDETGFLRLKYIVGYCDHEGQYPEEINLSGNEVIVR